MDKHRPPSGVASDLDMLKDESFPKTEKVNKAQGAKFYAFLKKINVGFL